MNQQQFIPVPVQIQQQEQPHEPNYPPARIRVALEYMNNLTVKQMVRAAVNDVSIETIDGQKLTTAESNAQACAANLLVDYFSGKFKPDHWEQKLMEHKLPIDQPGVVIRCPACISNARPGCILCGGEGQIICYPTDRKGLNG